MSLPVPVVITKGTLRPSEYQIWVYSVYDPSVKLKQVSSFSIHCIIVFAGIVLGCGVPSEPPTPLLCLPASGNLRRAVVTRAPPYFWQVWDVCLIRWVFFLLPSQALKRSDHPSHVVCQLCPCLVYQGQPGSYGRPRSHWHV